MEKILLGIDALEFLKKEGFSILESRITISEETAASHAKEIGFPVTLKISSKTIIHKTEFNGVKTLLLNEKEVKSAFNEIVHTFNVLGRARDLDGIIVQETGKGLEFIVGVYMDRQFGHVIMFGQGGIYVEASKDVSFRPIPITRKDAKAMMEELDVWKIITSPRQKKINPAMIEDFLLKISEFVEKNKMIEEMDLNPVFISEKINICDARIKICEENR
ncbi:MAG TPA: acetate--CoA ligase family protein [Syntrophorhabdaceae bacterium]|nr:acetate--CoA ligase family protein [Syntrophorhabdaceae bacterium]HPU29174.1 acetate--CoA ligase family protein [Syntrophorhabdaceae bacterium]